MFSAFCEQGKTRLIASAVTAVAALGFASGAPGQVTQSGEKKDMHRIGHVDLQGRSAYQPNMIVYPDGRTIAFVGTHAGSAPNPLNDNVVEPNGTMIVDITDPARPVETYHIAGFGGNSQMVRMCLGSTLPGGTAGHVYLLRNFASGYEIYDVTDVSNPVLKSQLTDIRSTHKLWWECSTGIAYLPGSKNAAPLWAQDQSMVIVDWKDPNNPPIYLRTFGLPGGQPGGSGDVPSLHGPISTYEHPKRDELLVSGSDIIGNRVYMAYGVGDDGILQILDRSKLLPAAQGGSWNGVNPDTPTDAELLAPEVGRLTMSPDQGGHTSMPVFGLTPPSYQFFAEAKKRDIVVLSSEATSNRCNEAPHWAFNVDVSFEDRPFSLATMSVDPRAGEKYPRGNYCTRGARFGVHSSEENFKNPFYGKLTVLAYFTGGVRVWDIREPHAPVEVAFYVPESNAFTIAAGYQTNNVEVDNRGYILAADRNRAGLDILQLAGQAKQQFWPKGGD